VTQPGLYCPFCGATVTDGRCEDRDCVSVAGWECPTCEQDLDACECDPEDGTRLVDLRLPCPYCGDNVAIAACQHIVAADWERLGLDETNRWAISPFQGMDLGTVDAAARVFREADDLGQQLSPHLEAMIEAWGTDHGGCYQLVLWERLHEILPGFADGLTVVNSTSDASAVFWLASDAGAMRRRIRDKIDELERACRRLVPDED
jgi:hypothetical protein